MESHEAPQPGHTVAGKYEIESVLGQGGMGTVFAARHAISGRRVALKWLEPGDDADDGALKRFLLEARAMGRIDHPNVVGVLDVGTEGGGAYLVMEILRGETLRALLDRERTLAPERAVALALGVMQGVEAAHRAGVVHRDLKPGNIFVVPSRNGTVSTAKVLDFGISKFHDESAAQLSAEALTQTGQVVGTPHYMAPEQVRGARVDGRTDEWAIATILYEMLAGRVPFLAPSCSALFVKIATEPYVPLDETAPHLPDGLVQVIHRALAKGPADRFPDVAAFARALEPYAGGAVFDDPVPLVSRSSPSLDPGISRPPAPPRPAEQPTADLRPRQAVPRPDETATAAVHLRPRPSLFPPSAGARPARSPTEVLTPLPQDPVTLAAHTGRGVKTGRSRSLRGWMAMAGAAAVLLAAITFVSLDRARMVPVDPPDTVLVPSELPSVHAAHAPLPVPLPATPSVESHAMAVPAPVLPIVDAAVSPPAPAIAVNAPADPAHLHHRADEHAPHGAVMPAPTPVTVVAAPVPAAVPDAGLAPFHATPGRSGSLRHGEF